MSNNKNGVQFPFQYIDFPCKDGINKPIIEQINSVLDSNIQNPNSFGCKIENCHTHAGSKIHFNNFIEAELLFHNSSYNKAFAFLTFDWLKRHSSEYLNDTHFDNILLIGYEKYSELYIQELRDIIKNQTNKECCYCVYETVAETQANGSRKNIVTIRNLKGFSKKQELIIEAVCEKDNCYYTGLYEQKLLLEKTLCLFIVPINTTLSTLDKMISKFYLSISNEANKINIQNINREHICLITLYNDSNENGDDEYWKFNKKDKNIIIPQNNKFEFLNEQNRIHNIVTFKTSWFPAKYCKKCYPNNLLKEEPIFGVNRGSVVPMLQIGTVNALVPISDDAKNKALENLNNVSKLSNYLIYKHISRGENHFQFYIDTGRLIFNEKKDIERFLESIKNQIKFVPDDTQVFDYLVAPRHESNAPWVHLINKVIFNGAARIIYFDVGKEFRCNLKAKYSDISCSLDNIERSNQKYKVRFFYVDDSIQSGTTFLRTKNLISSLINNSPNTEIFNSVFVLINRLSLETQKFYLENTQNFFKYINVNISPMRSYEDACTLCKLIADYYCIRSQCATNNLAQKCTEVIKRHLLTSFFGDADHQEEQTDSKLSKEEKKLLFFITHLLNERLSNNLYFYEIEDNKPINYEADSDEIKSKLENYYNNYSIILKETSFDSTTDLLWKIAFIKAISRPFFIYHIRQRQAAFSFCLEHLNMLLFNIKIIDIDKEKSVLIKTFVKALSDLNANYIIRKKTLQKLSEVAVKYDDFVSSLKNDDDKYFYKRRLFSEKSLLHYIKKNLVLSRDTTKSVFLENILLKGEEPSKNEFVSKPSSVKDYVCKNELTFKANLYLENNVVIKNGLNNSNQDNNLGKLLNSLNSNKIPYFFSNLNQIWKMNTNEDLICQKDVIEEYQKIIKIFESFCNPSKEQKNSSAKNADEEKLFTSDINIRHPRTDFSTNINELFKCIDDEEIMQVITFVHDSSESNPLFQFFTLAGNPAKGKNKLNSCRFDGLKTSQAFFYDKNIQKIKEALVSKKDCDVFFIKDTLTNNDESLIIRFGTDIDPTIDVDPDNSISDSIVDESIYLQIWGFNKNNVKHWFSLKLLLTLRENFSMLIKKINLQELIEERKVIAQKEALSIKKATTHAKIDRYYQLDFLLENSYQSMQYYNYYVKYSKSRKKTIPILYDKYIQLLSDDFLASIYKRIIKREACFDNSSHAKELCLEEFLDQILHVLGVSDGNSYKKSNLKLNDPNQIIIDRNIIIKIENENKEIHLVVKLHIPQNEWNNYTVYNWSSEISSEMRPTILFILLTVNAAEHGNVTDVKAEISENGVSFSNIITYEGAENLVDLQRKKKNEIEMYYSIPPWVMENQHLTLWTLFHACGITESDDFCTSLKPTVDIIINENDKLSYKITFKLINRRDNNE